MKAVVVREWSDNMNFVVEDVPEPQPAAGELLVQVHTVGISFADFLIATGRYQVRPQLPFTPGVECSGTVKALGPDVSGYQIGDQVAAMGWVGNSRTGKCILGCCAERIRIPVQNALKVPNTIDLERAALFRSNNETSFFGLQRGCLRAGQTLLVLGAGGGTGYAAVELGKVIGARVIASASSPEKRALAQRAGADFTIDSRAEDWRSQVASAAGPAGVDVVYDPVGGSLSEQAFRALGYNGRHVVIGFASGSIPRIALNLPLMKASSIIGANMLATGEAEPQLLRNNALQLMELFAQGKLSTPPVVRRFALDELSQAYAAVASGDAVGRIVASL